MNTFLTGLYRDLLNREPDSDGFSYFMSFLKNNGTKIDVFREVVKSSEFGTLLSQTKLIHVLQNIISRSDYNFVKQLYHNIWGTAPKLSQLQMNVEKLRNQSISKKGFIQNTLLDEEFLTRLNQPHTSNTPEFSVLNRLITIFNLDRNDFINELYSELFDETFEKIELIKHADSLRFKNIQNRYLQNIHKKFGVHGPTLQPFILKLFKADSRNNETA